MNKFTRDLISSLEQAAAHARGEKTNVRVTEVIVIDAKAVRRRLKMSQRDFAEAYHIPLPTLKNWEQKRRFPDAPAAAYLEVIAKKPKLVRDALK